MILSALAEKHGIKLGTGMLNIRIFLKNGVFASGRGTACPNSCPQIHIFDSNIFDVRSKSVR